MRELNYYLSLFFSLVRGYLGVSGHLFWFGATALALSRLAQVLAFFLPLKIFFVISSGTPPKYFSGLLVGMPFSELILIMSSLVPVFYVIFIGLGVTYRRLSDTHLECLRGHDIELNDRTLGRKKKFRIQIRACRAFSDLGLLALSVLIALVLQPIVALTLFLLFYLNLLLFFHTALKSRQGDRLTFLKLHRRQFVDYVSSTNFLLVFALIAGLLIMDHIGVYSAVFLLLISRLVFQALNRFTNESLFILKLLPKDLRP